jgi:NADH dehydrogenase
LQARSSRTGDRDPEATALEEPIQGEEDEPLKLAVTGGAGFLGRHVVALGAAAGHALRVLSRDPEAAARVVGQGEGVTTERFDLARPAETIRAWADDPPDVLIHAAAVIEGTPEELNAANVEGMAALIEALTDLPRPPRVVLVSSFATEDTPPTPYSDSKLAAETLLRESELDHVILRPSLIYGPGDRGNAAGVADRLREGTMWLPAGGRTTIQPVYVEDVAAACLAAAERADVLDKTYRLGGPEPVSVRGFRKALRDASGGHARIRGIPLPLFALAARGAALLGKRGALEVLAFHRVTHEVDSSKATSDLGFRPRSLAEGLALTFPAD